MPLCHDLSELVMFTGTALLYADTTVTEVGGVEQRFKDCVTSKFKDHAKSTAPAQQPFLPGLLLQV